MMIDTRIGGYAEMPLWSDRLAVRVMARQKQNNRDLDDRRYEHGTVMLRSTASLRVWSNIYVVGGVDDCIDAPGAWVAASWMSTSASIDP